MTVRYAAGLATNTSLGCFTKLLFRWRGSVYKLIWAEYLVFITLYYIIRFVYRFGLNDDQQRFFEKVAKYGWDPNAIEMSFVLGFFVTSIVTKFWKLYESIPWPDPVAYFIDANICGDDDETKQIKKTIMRYCSLSLILTFRFLSPPLKKRYPTLDHLVKDGMLTRNEKANLKMSDATTNHPNHWLPIKWASRLVTKAAKDGKVLSDFACQRIIDELDKFRHGCALLLEYEDGAVPLVYIQVVTISVYTYFFFCLFGRQWLIVNDDAKNLDMYFPIFTTLQFIFYMGWLKVAESLINPFGCDDDDFELDEIIHRHLEVTYQMVSETGDDDEYVHSRFTNKDNGTATTTAHFVNEAYRNDYEWVDSASLMTNHKRGNNFCWDGTAPSPPPPEFSDVVLNPDGMGEGQGNGENGVVGGKSEPEYAEVGQVKSHEIARAKNGVFEGKLDPEYAEIAPVKSQKNK